MAVLAKRKRLSGAQYSKRRAEKQKDETKQEGSFLKYLSTPHREEDGPELNNQTDADNEAEERRKYQFQKSLNHKIKCTVCTKKQNLKDIYHGKISLVYMLTMVIMLLGPNLMIVCDKF